METKKNNGKYPRHDPLNNSLYKVWTAAFGIVFSFLFLLVDMLYTGAGPEFRERGCKIFFQIHATMWSFSGRIFKELSFPMFFELEFLLFTLSFLCYLFRFSLKLSINLLGSQHV